MAKKIKTSELIGPALDWAVARCEGKDVKPVRVFDEVSICEAIQNNYGKIYPHPIDNFSAKVCIYSTNWSQGGPIIGREGISVLRLDDDIGVDERGFCNGVRIPVWAAAVGQRGPCSSTEHQTHDSMFQIFEDEAIRGPTPLVAAMRCRVASKLGEEVEVPDELLE